VHSRGRDGREVCRRAVVWNASISDSRKRFCAVRDFPDRTTPPTRTADFKNSRGMRIRSTAFGTYAALVVWDSDRVMGGRMGRAAKLTRW